MAKKRKFKERPPVTTPVLDELGLTKGQDIRYRQDENSNWSEGRLTGDNKDGSLTIFDPYTGHTRSMLVDNVEVRTLGPRGGVNWVSCSKFSELVSL